MMYYEEYRKTIKCSICGETADKVCILIGSEQDKLTCLKSLESLSDKTGDWVAAIKTFKDLGIYDKVIEAYAKAAGKSEFVIRYLFNNAVKLQEMRAKTKPESEPKHIRVIVVKETPEQIEVLINPNLPVEGKITPALKDETILSEPTVKCNSQGECHPAIRRVIYTDKIKHPMEEVVSKIDKILEKEDTCERCEEGILSEVASQQEEKIEPPIIEYISLPPPFMPRLLPVFGFYNPGEKNEE